MKFDLVLRDWVKTESKTEEFSPQDSPFKLAKSLDVTVILVREKDDDEISKWQNNNDVSKKNEG